MFVDYAVPVLSLAFVAWAAARRRLSSRPRRMSMVATIPLACGVMTLLRTGGITGDRRFGFPVAVGGDSRGTSPRPKLAQRAGGPPVGSSSGEDFRGTVLGPRHPARRFIDLSKHCGDGLVVSVVARNCRDLCPEACLLDASTSRENSRTGVGKTESYTSPYPTAGTSHERNLFAQVGHSRSSSIAFRLSDSKSGRPA
jgi:hypothetical protein